MYAFITYAFHYKKSEDLLDSGQRNFVTRVADVKTTQNLHVRAARMIYQYATQPGDDIKSDAVSIRVSSRFLDSIILTVDYRHVT